jgi:hypothetical protein
MKVVFSAIFMSAMLLASAGGASATSYLQASSTEEQMAEAGVKPKVITMNSTDASKNIKQEKGVVRVNETGAFFVMAAVQVGTKAKGTIRVWMRQNGKDIDNSNTEQFLGDPNSTTVLVCQGVAEAKRGDKFEVVFSGSDPSVGVVIKKPMGEPVVPSIIFSAWRID